MLNDCEMGRSQVFGAVRIGIPVWRNLEVVCGFSAQKTEPLFHAMDDCVAEGHWEYLGGATEFGNVGEELVSMSNLSGALASEDVWLRFNSPAGRSRAEVCVRCPVLVSLSQSGEPAMNKLNQACVIGLAVLGKGEVLGSPKDVVVLVDCPVVLVDVVLAKLCLALETTEAFIGAVGERVKAVGECWEA